MRRLGGELDSLLVQRVVPRGVEMLVGALQDPMFGPLVVCGAGGTLVDLLADTAFRLNPLTVEDAAEMVDELRVAPLLRGCRGATPVDEPALRDLLLRVSARRAQGSVLIVGRAARYTPRLISNQGGRDGEDR